MNNSGYDEFITMLLF